MITTEQRQLRQRYVGSSDAPAILGVDPFRSAYDVWLEKTGQADGFAGNADTDRGNLLEPVLLTWAEGELARLLDRPVTFHRDRFIDRPNNLCANLDAAIFELSLDRACAVVEAKTATNPDEWGEPLTDQVPDRVVVQVHHQMHVAGGIFRVAWVPVLLPLFNRFDFRLYRVDRNDELADIVAAKGVEFWRNHVEPRVPPTNCLPSLEVLKRVRREPNKVVPVADDLVDAVVVARAACRQAEEDCHHAEAALLAAMGDAEGGTYSRGQVTYLESKRKGYVVSDTTFRALRIKANKGGRS